MAAVRNILIVFAVFLAAQATTYALRRELLNAWPTVDLGLALLAVAAAASVVAAFRPEPTALAIATSATLATYGLRVAEISWALTSWGRLADVSATARATAWVALSRDATTTVAVAGLWVLIARQVAERTADVAAIDDSRAGRGR